MKRSKRLILLLGVLALIVVATVGLSFFQKRTEKIQNSGAVILQVPADTVTALSWEYEGEKLSFHKEDVWRWDEDPAFPVDQETVRAFLSRFEDFGVSFVIEDVEDYGQYGLDNPLCVIDFTAGEESFRVELGDFSQMDSKRYVSVGDGNVYLVNQDPLDDFDAAISDMIDHDEVPAFENVSAITFSGAVNDEISYMEGGGNSPCGDDVYFTKRDGRALPLDTSLVDGYLSQLAGLNLKDYATYNATAEELADYGLNEPELTAAVEYTPEGDGGEEQPRTFVLHVSRDPREAARAEKAGGDETSGDTEEITAYARVGESPIVYKIDGDSYRRLMAASYDDLRHRELFTADFDTVTSMDVSLEGEEYTLTSRGGGEDAQWDYAGEETDVAALRGNLEGLRADRFTAEEPEDKLEIGLTVHLDNENFPTVEIELYRYDGEYCLAKVDGESVALVPRTDAVELIESVHAIVLGGSAPAEEESE